MIRKCPHTQVTCWFYDIERCSGQYSEENCAIVDNYRALETLTLRVAQLEEKCCKRLHEPNKEEGT